MKLAAIYAWVSGDQDFPPLVVLVQLRSFDALGWLNSVGSSGFELATQLRHRGDLSADMGSGPFELHAALPRM